MTSREAEARLLARDIRNCDPLALGSDAPRDEYDAIAASIYSRLREGANVAEILSTTERFFREEWGADISPAGRSRLEALLTDWGGRGARDIATF